MVVTTCILWGGVPTLTDSMALRWVAKVGDANPEEKLKRLQKETLYLASVCLQIWLAHMEILPHFTTLWHVHFRYVRTRGRFFKHLLEKLSIFS